MSSTLNTAPHADARPDLPTSAVIPALVWFLGLLILCYAPILYALVNHWIVDEDMGHAFFVPVIACYVAWSKREELAAANLQTNAFGLVLIAWAAFQSIIGTLGAELFTSRTAFLFSVIGCVFFFGGLKAIRILSFPLFLLFFMIPIPAIIYNQITFPLQLLASRLAELILGLAGIPVIRDGNVLELASQKLSVVEACSGIRSLLSLSFLSLIFGYFFDDKPWMKWVLLASTVPIAITANASRVTLTGLLSEVNVEYSQGVYHSLSGWVVFMVALVILAVFHQFVNQLYGRCRKKES